MTTRTQPKVASVIVLAAALTSIGPLATDMYLSAFPEVGEALSADAAAVGASLSVFIFGLAAGQLVYGPLSDRFGRRPLLIVGLLVFAIASGLCALAQGAAPFIALRLAQALGGCCGVVLARAIVRDLCEEREAARVFSALSMIGMVAPIVAPSLGVAVIALAGWRGIFCALTLYGLLSAAAVWMWLPETLPPYRRGEAHGTLLAGLSAALRNRAFLTAAATAGAAAGILFAFITGSSFVFVAQLGMPKVTFAVAFGAVVAGMIACSHLNRLALRRSSPAVLLDRATATAAALGVALPFATLLGPWVLYAGAFVLIATLGFVLGNSTALAVSAVSHGFGSAASLLGAIQFGTGFASSLLVAAFQNGTPWPMVAMMSACAVLGFAAWRLRPV